jgi:predicted small secreted protein
MLKKIIKISVAALSLVIAACGGAGNDIKVKKFAINGSSTELEDGQVTLDSSINSGKFQLNWKVDDDHATGYTATFYASINDDLSSSDIEFYSIYCSESGRCDHDDDNDENCWLDNNWALVCRDDDNEEQKIDELIGEIPQNLYIILEACNSMECDTKAVAVRIR